ncbi:unnamed protein product [Cladocopium goreaui]|uniref:Uncharacterized protein n=1 Tax=Cladocopium goreaui TaxID=2562237 RepID=A0A9P1CD49_9DINO|nr:unnamed protein product [Cladocopium goreaui]
MLDFLFSCLVDGFLVPTSVMSSPGAEKLGDLTLELGLAEAWMVPMKDEWVLQLRLVDFSIQVGGDFQRQGILCSKCAKADTWAKDDLRSRVGPKLSNFGPYFTVGYERPLLQLRFATMKEQEALVSSFCVDGTTYEAALTNCRDDWKRTFWLLSKLPRKWRSLSCLNSAMGEEPWEQSMELMAVMKHQEVEADVITHKAMINSFGRGMQWKATLGELIPLRKQALIALHRKEAMVGWGDDFETSPWKEVDGEKWREVERISRWR